MQRNTILNRQWGGLYPAIQCDSACLKNSFRQQNSGGLKMVGLYSGGH